MPMSSKNSKCNLFYPFSKENTKKNGAGLRANNKLNPLMTSFATLVRSRCSHQNNGND